MSDAPTFIEREPPFRTTRNWTPAMLALTELRADGGHLQLAADLCEFLLADDRVKGVMDARASALFGTAVSFETGLGRNRRRALRALEVEEDYWSIFPEATCKQLFAWAHMLGIAVAQQTYVRRGDREVPWLTFKHPRNLRYDYEGRRWMLKVADPDREIVVTPGDGWFLYTPYGAPDSRPWSFGIFRSLARWMLGKAQAQEDWMAYLERHGMGILAVNGFTGTDQQREQIQRSLSRLGRRGSVVLGPESELKLVEAVANTWQAYKGAIDSADAAAVITILHQNLTTSVSEGAQASATVHAGVKLAETRSDGETWSTQTHEQILVPYCRYNFGDEDGRAAPWVVFDTAPKADMKARADVVQQVAQAVSTFKGAAALVDEETLLDEFEVPRRAPIAAE